MKALLSGCLALALCGCSVLEFVYRGSSDRGTPLSLVVLDRQQDGYRFVRFGFVENSTTGLQLEQQGSGGVLESVPIGFQAGNGGSRFYLGLKRGIVLYNDSLTAERTLQPSDERCGLLDFRVNDEETFLVARVSCGANAEVTQQKLWVYSLIRQQELALIDNPSPSTQPFKTVDSDQDYGFGKYPYTLTSSRVYLVKDVLGDPQSSNLYTLPLNASPLGFSLDYQPERVQGVRNMFTFENTALVSTSSGVYRILDTGRLGDQVSTDSYSRFWATTSPGLARAALWNDAGGFNPGLRFLSGLAPSSARATLNGAGQVRDLIFVPLTGFAYYLDATQLGQVDVARLDSGASLLGSYQSYTSLGLQNPVGIGWILRP